MDLDLLGCSVDLFHAEQLGMNPILLYPRVHPGLRMAVKLGMYLPNGHFDRQNCDKI